MDGAGKLVNLALFVVDGVSFTGSLLLHFVDPNHRVHWNVASFDPRELGLQPLLCRATTTEFRSPKSSPSTSTKPNIAPWLTRRA
jgi:hypothetical protein